MDKKSNRSNKKSSIKPYFPNRRMSEIEYESFASNCPKLKELNELTILHDKYDNFKIYKLKDAYFIQFVKTTNYEIDKMILTLFNNILQSSN